MSADKLLGILLRHLLKRSISKKGVRAPVLISKSGVVVDGNHRVILARELGIQVPIIRLNADIEWINPDELITYYDEARRDAPELPGIPQGEARRSG